MATEDLDRFGEKIIEGFQASRKVRSGTYNGTSRDRDGIHAVFYPVKNSSVKKAVGNKPHQNLILR